MGLSWASHSTLIYTSELILCCTICVHSATRHNIHMYPYLSKLLSLCLPLQNREFFWNSNYSEKTSVFKPFLLRAVFLRVAGERREIALAVTYWNPWVLVSQTPVHPWVGLIKGCKQNNLSRRLKHRRFTMLCRYPTRSPGHLHFNLTFMSKRQPAQPLAVGRIHIPRAGSILVLAISTDARQNRGSVDRQQTYRHERNSAGE